MITNFWVAIETLSLAIKDAMCGYRAYPLQPTMEIVEKYSIAKRMCFDIEIIVRLYWAGMPIVSMPTHIIYPPHGISHFKIFRDNLAIARTHTRLFFGMLIRLPRLLFRNRHENKHWSHMKEKGCLFGLKFTLYSYKILGRKCTHLLLYPIMAYFYLTSPTARKASKQYLSHLQCPQYSSFKHFLSFGESVLDKFAVWNNDLSIKDIDCPNAALIYDQVAQKKGGVILTAHLGNIEIARALSQCDPNIKINALVFNQHAQRINALLAKTNARFAFNIIQLDKPNIALAMQLKEKVDAGEFIVIVGDRTSTTQPDRTIPSEFLGHTVHFPQGPFVLASVLQCPVYFMLCVKEKDQRFKIIFEPFTQTPSRPLLTEYTQKYAQLLEKYCKQYPLQWFNFFNFWKSP